MIKSFYIGADIVVVGRNHAFQVKCNLSYIDTFGYCDAYISRLGSVILNDLMDSPCDYVVKLGDKAHPVNNVCVYPGLNPEPVIRFKLSLRDWCLFTKYPATDCFFGGKVVSCRE